MKKALIISILLLIIIIVLKYYISDYELSYIVDNHKVITKYHNSRFYYEIDNEYNFDVYKKRSMKKNLINKIETISSDNFECIVPIIKGIDTYPLCYQDGMLTDYNLIDSETLDFYKTKPIAIDKSNETFSYYKNLDDNIYVALWNYKGYIIMNGDTYKNIELFEKDRYDNSLSYLKDNIIYMPNYNQEHEFDEIIALDIETNKYNKYNIDYKIDYDSYIVGSIKNIIYVFDNKHSVLYEIDTKKNEAKIKSNNETGYVKYINGEFVSCSKSEYKVNKITYDKKESIYRYKYNNGLIKTIAENERINTMILNKEVSIIKEYNNILYYIDEDYLYRYKPLVGSEKVLYFFELNFNKQNTIFIYNK